MTLSRFRLELLSAAHLEALVEDGVSEGRRIEFKEVVGTDDEAKREFLADASSFANAAGGDLLVGVAEEGGIAAGLPGLPAPKTDAEILRLENILRDGLDPRVPGLRIQPVAVNEDAAVLVIRIPRSWAAPHMVTFRGASRFYSRNSAGKYQLDVAEIRTAFSASESARTYLRSFRLERLGRLAANDGQIPLLPEPKTVLHVLPLGISDPSVRLDVERLEARNNPSFRPLYGGSYNTRINFDGVLTFVPQQGSADARSYTQMYRTGAIEGVDAVLLRRTEQGARHLIPSVALEKALIGRLGDYFSLLREFEVPGPFVVALSLFGVRGLEMAVDQRRFDDGHPIDRDDLIVPETLIGELTDAPDVVLKPQIDAIWNATGYPGSHNYDEAGRWHDRR